MQAARRFSTLWVVTGGSIALGVTAFAGVQLLDRVAAESIDRLREPLERSLGGSLGHPIRFGAYRGLRPWGVAIGPTVVTGTDQDPSTLHLRELQVQLKPLASLRQWRPVLHLRLDGLKAHLHRQEDGRYWRFGTPSVQKDPPPDLDLRVSLAQPAELQLLPTGEQLLLETQGSVLLRQARFQTSSRLRWSDPSGSLSAKVSGRWDRPQLVVATELRNLELQPLNSLLPLPGESSLLGRAQGDVAVRWSPGTLACDGRVRVQQLTLQTAGLPGPLRSPHVSVGCRKNRLTLERSRFSSGDWNALTAGSVTLQRSVDLRVDLSSRERRDRVAIAVTGPWANPRWLVNGALAVPALSAPLQLRGELRTPWTDPANRSIQVDDAVLQAPGLRLQLAGVLGARNDLRSKELQLSPELWAGLGPLTASIGEAAPVHGALNVKGSLTSPVVGVELSQSRNLVLEQWGLKASWSQASGLAVLERFDSPVLQASAQLPLRWGDGALQLGELQGGLALDSFPLARLSSWVGVPLEGRLSARGRMAGSWPNLRPELAVELLRPGVGPIAMPERWQGRLAGQFGTGVTLALRNRGSGVHGEFRFQGAGVPPTVDLFRDSGRFQLRKTLDGPLRWQADQLSLQGLQLALPFSGEKALLSGRLSGEGDLLPPARQLRGAIRLEDPALRGLALRQLSFEGELSSNRFRLKGQVSPEQGELQFTGSGLVDGAVQGRLDAKALDVPWLLESARLLRGDASVDGVALGRAADLGTLVIDTFGGSLDGQLQALRQARRELEAFDGAQPSSALDPSDLKGRLDAAVDISGPRFTALSLDAEARAHLWIDGGDRDHILQQEPVVARVRGALQGGQGEFSLLHLPFSLLALLAPVPAALRGALGATGRYDLSGAGPVVRSELSLEKALFGTTPLVLDRRRFEISANGLLLDLALRGEPSTESIQISGLVPLTLQEEFDLNLEAHGDALRFLGDVTGDALTITRGSTDLRLIVRGFVDQPAANGFLVVRDGAFRIGDQGLKDVSASVLFDFNRLEIRQLEAQLGSGGRLSAEGAIGLFRSREEPVPLTIRLQQGRIKQSIVDLTADGEVTIHGALNQPELSGQLNLSQGVIQPRSGLLAQLRRGLKAGGGGIPGGVQPSEGMAGASAVALPSLLEETWDYQEPLVLFGPGVPSPGFSSISDLVPSLPALRFRQFRLGLGSDLQVQMPPLISFRGGGQLLLNGPLDPSLELRGLIRLDHGRVSLFSTSFRLDRRAPNVAVFTPALGLVPFVDIAMTSRVSDSTQQPGSGSTTSSNTFETNGLGVMGDGGGRLRLVKVTVQATGPADRLRENLELRGSPPMSQAQLLSLIGGNSLSGLAGAGGVALAAVVGQSLLSPVLGTLTDAMGQRMQIALFPTYVTPDVKDERERTSGRVAPTFTLVTEIGVDVSDRFDLSVLAAPNTTDVPPQATVTYRLTPNTSVSGSVDSNGTWQSQLQVFFRF